MMCRGIRRIVCGLRIRRLFVGELDASLVISFAEISIQVLAGHGETKFSLGFRYSLVGSLVIFIPVLILIQGEESVS
jgi:hypothetical protein